MSIDFDWSVDIDTYDHGGRRKYPSGQAPILQVEDLAISYQTRQGELSVWKGCAGANAARNGLFAALLAQAGVTGPSPPAVPRHSHGKRSMNARLGCTRRRLKDHRPGPIAVVHGDEREEEYVPIRRLRVDGHRGEVGVDLTVVGAEGETVGAGIVGVGGVDEEGRPTGQHTVGRVIDYGKSQCILVSV